MFNEERRRIALRTMTDKGTLWFSDIRKSNDRKELVYGFNQIKKRLETLVSDDRSPRRYDPNQRTWGVQPRELK